MAGKWIEGFETHTGVSQLDRKYAQRTGSITVQPGRVHGNAGGVNGSVFVTPSLGLSTTYVLGFGMRLASQQTGLNSGAQGWYFEKGPNEQCHIEIQSNAGSFELRIMRGSTEVAITAQSFSYAVWHYFEIKLTIDDTTGAYEVRQNEVNVLSGSSVNLADDTGSQADIFAFRFTSNVSSTLFIDDLYILDTTGADNNDFRGDSIAEGVLPNGAGNSTQWTNDAGSGSNFNNVDDPANAVDDTGAGGTNSSDTNGQKDLYAYQDLVQIQGNIHFVQVGTQLAMSAAGSRTVKSVYRDPDTTEADGDTHSVNSTSFDEFSEVFDVNPASSAAWDVNDINNGEFGVEVVS